MTETRRFATRRGGRVHDCAIRVGPTNVGARATQRVRLRLLCVRVLTIRLNKRLFSNESIYTDSMSTSHRARRRQKQL